MKHSKGSLQFKYKSVDGMSVVEDGVIPCDVTFWTARWITLDYNVVHLKA